MARVRYIVLIFYNFKFMKLRNVLFQQPTLVQQLHTKKPFPINVSRISLCSNSHRKPCFHYRESCFHHRDFPACYQFYSNVQHQISRSRDFFRDFFHEVSQFASLKNYEKKLWKISLDPQNMMPNIRLFSKSCSKSKFKRKKIQRVERIVF